MSSEAKGIQRQHLSAHAAISACRGYRRSNLETPRCGIALEWLSYIVAVGLAPGAISAYRLRRSGRHEPRTATEAAGGGWGADLAMAMWVPLVGLLPRGSALGASTAEPWLGKQLH